MEKYSVAVLLAAFFAIANVEATKPESENSELEYGTKGMISSAVKMAAVAGSLTYFTSGSCKLGGCVACVAGLVTVIDTYGKEAAKKKIKEKRREEEFKKHYEEFLEKVIIFSSWQGMYTGSPAEREIERCAHNFTSNMIKGRTQLACLKSQKHTLISGMDETAETIENCFKSCMQHCRDAYQQIQHVKNGEASLSIDSSDTEESD